MKKIVVSCFILAMVFAGITSVYAQGDVVTLVPKHGTSDPCTFNLSISNHNAAAKNIDEIKLVITTANGTTFSSFTGPSTHWPTTITGGDLIADAVADYAGIAPNATLSGFIFSYFNDGSHEYNNPVSITWTTRNAGTDLSTGTIGPICTPFQSYDQNDTATVNASQSGCDPCFAFTLIDRNSQSGSSIQIWHAAFQLANPTGGTMRPSKITAPQDWLLDSVTPLTAYFHTDVNPLDKQSHPAVGGFNVCLRGNPNVSKYNFVWFASNDQNTLIDRDTIFNISNTTTCSTTEDDVVSFSSVTGCLYNVTLKNYHVSNLLPPSRIVKLVLTSKTAGVTFSSAPSAPPNWKQTVTPTSIIYAANNDSAGISSGLISKNQFSFSVSGPTTSNFDIGWETDRSAAPATVSTGTLTQKCTVATPANDTASFTAGPNECDFKLTVKNSHNIKPQSTITQVVISIPAGTGQISPAGGTWNTNNIPTTQIKYTAPTPADGIQADNSSQDFAFRFSPKNPGTPVTATWSTFDDDAVKSGTPVTTGSGMINCSPKITICDTVTRTASLSNDSCTKTFTLHNRKPTDIVSLVLTVTNGWKIDTASTPPTGWTKQMDGSHTFVTYTSTDGLKSDQSQDFILKFSGYFPQPVDTFTVNAITTDRNSVVCTSVDSEISCISHILQSVQPHSDNIGVTNFAIQPNPTRGSADISFQISTPQRVVVTVFDVLGHQISILSNKLMSEGTYHVPYAMDGLSDGTYYIRMQTPLGVMTQKLVLTK